MNVKGKAPGFRYIHLTDDVNVAVVRFSGEGIGGWLGLARLEWVIKNHDSESIARCCADLTTKAPLWAIENGDAEAAQEEVHKWANPAIYEAMRAWE